MGDEQIVRWFLDQGAELPTPDPRRSRHILNTAARVSSITNFDLLLERGANIADSTALHQAALIEGSDRIAMMSHLLEIGYDINAIDEGRHPCNIGTPLHYALWGKLFENVRFLLQRGADPHKCGGLCGSAFTMAERTCRDEFISLMKQHT